MLRDRERRGVRQYNRTDAPRLRWTDELHGRFLVAINSLGGHEKATPKRILELMCVKGVRISHVKSHLQMYRNMCNPINLHSSLSTRHLHRKRKTNSKNVTTCVQAYYDHIQLISKSSSYSFQRSSPEEVSNELNTRLEDSDIKRCYERNARMIQHQETREGESIVEFDTTDEKSYEDLASHGHPLGGQINLELTMSSSRHF